VPGADSTDDPGRGGAVCLVHLVWAPLGPERLARFLDACRRADPGAPHRLLVLLNGFPAGEDLSPWQRLLAGVEHDELRLERPVLDLAAYREAVERVRADRYCFVNSYSEPAVSGWLAKLDAALAQTGVGLAGATGSWASTRSLTAHVLRLPSAYRGVLPAPGLAVQRLMSIEADRTGSTPPPPHRDAFARTRARLRTLAEVPSRTLPYERFPAYHIRTNAFMIRHSTLAALRQRPVRGKHDAYLIENGRASITRQVQRKGLRTVVVDRDGRAYDHQQWHLSRTFWQGDQEGLLVSDNQTRYYDETDADRRSLLSAFAWGREADPAAR
jgi:hypothetical protein